jgi:hypothetical protein
MAKVPAEISSPTDRHVDFFDGALLEHFSQGSEMEMLRTTV